MHCMKLFLNSIAGENPDDVKVVKTVPTGKAVIRAKLNKLKVIFIDEISMVGTGMFNFLNLRLQQIMGTSEPFGGISLVTVGDIFQLKPVFDKWIFENSQSGYYEFNNNNNNFIFLH